MIILSEIDLGKEFPESVGMSPEEFQRLEERMPVGTEALEEKLGFCIAEALIGQMTVSEVLVALCKQQGKTEISLEECVMIALLIIRKRSAGAPH